MPFQDDVSNLLQISFELLRSLVRGTIRYGTADVTLCMQFVWSIGWQWNRTKYRALGHPFGRARILCGASGGSGIALSIGH